MSDTPSWKSFPATFWSANTIELFERAAYYAMAGLMMVYLTKHLGMTPTFAGFINGTLLWGLIYFLPLFSGSMADKYGFRRSLVLAFGLLTVGYVILGNLQRYWPKMAGPSASGVLDFTLPVIVGVVFVGVGGSIVKPCIAGTVQKTSGTMATLAFGIFYMVINIGSICGRLLAYYIRNRSGNMAAAYFPVAALFAVLGFLVVLLIFREPQYVSDGKKDNQQVKRKSIGQVLSGMVDVFSQPRFVLFLLVVSLFWFLYVQLYNLVPLFLSYIDPKVPIELYQMFNPLMIVTLQLVITRAVKKWTPVRSIMIGIAVTSLGMLVNVIPALTLADPKQRTAILGITLPVAGIFLIASIASMAIGEMMASPRIYEYLGAIAPKGEEGLYMGYANLPIAVASLVGGPIGGRLFEVFIDKPVKAGQPANIAPMWLIVAGIGLVSFIGMAIYNHFLTRQTNPLQPR